MARVLADMGYQVDNGELKKAPEATPPAREGHPAQDFTTMGEHARFKAERAKLNEPPANPPAKPTETPPATPPATPPKTDTPPATPAPPTKPKLEVEKGKPIEEIVEGVLNRLQKAPDAPVKPSEPKPDQNPKEDPDASYIESLDENQREEVSLARFAAKAMPDKYGNLPKKMVDYLKKTDEFIAAKLKEDPEWNPDEDEAFASFVEENRPSYQTGDRKKLERSMIAEEVRAEVNKDLQPKLAEAEKSTRIQQVKPEIEKAVPAYRKQVFERIATDEKSPIKDAIAKAVEKGLTEEAWTEASAIDPLAAAIGKSFTEDAVSFGQLYLELATGVRDQVPYRPDLPLNHKHNQEAMRQAKLFQFIDNQEAIFDEHGGQMKTVNGKTFVSRSAFVKMSAADQSKHWTIGHQDVLNLLSDSAAIGATEAYEMEQERRKKEGYVRNGKHEVPKKENPPASKTETASSSPKATITPSPGAGTPPPSPPSPTLMPKEALDKLLRTGVSQWVN